MSETTVEEAILEEEDLFEQYHPSADEISKAHLAVLRGQIDLATLAGFEDEELESLYARGLELLSAGQVLPATKIFLQLIFLKRREPRFLRGLGLCYQHKRQWNSARYAYLFALEYSPDDVITMALDGECALYTDGKHEAHRLLSRVVERGAKHPRESVYILRAQQILSKIRL